MTRVKVAFKEQDTKNKVHASKKNLKGKEICITENLLPFKPAGSERRSRPPNLDDEWMNLHKERPG